MEYIPAKHIITKTKTTQWFGSEYNMNIYRGCCHGCIYCDSRSDCYGIESFESVKAKENALTIIRDDLRRKVKKGVIGTGSMSDPYNPFEKDLKLTKNALELINSYEFGVAIATKGTLITRDIDILLDINQHSPVIAKITITAADEVSAITEPRAPSSSERFEAVNKLSDAGVFAGVLLMPVLPFIADTNENIKYIVKEASQAGAKFIYPGFGLTMRDSQREYFYEKLDKHYPGLKEKYIAKYKNSYSCPAPNAKELWGVFAKECEVSGILYSMKAIIQAYKHSKKGRQLSLFD